LPLRTGGSSGQQMLKNESMLDGSERVQDIVDFIFNLPLFEFL
jgi:hypothetical protein